MGADFEIDVLGDVALWHVDGGARSAAADLRRATRRLVAALVVARGRVVSNDELAEAMWPGEPPGQWLASLQAHVSRVRRVVGADVLASVRHGYRFDPDADAIDADRFERLVEQGAAALDGRAPGRAVDLLHAADALWLGRPFAPFSDDAFALTEARRLESVRLDAQELLADAEIATGRLAEAIGRLEAVVAVAPLREEAWSRLMRALYAHGRAADALRVFQRARGVLVDELGIEPGPALRALEHAVLEHDESILMPRGVERAAARAALPAWLRPPAALAGRDEALAALTAAWRDAQRGGRVLAVVSGEPGIGKSAVLARFATDRDAAGDVVLAGRCPPDTPTTFRPLADMFEPLLETHPELVRALGADGRGLAPILPHRREICGRPLDVTTDAEAARVLAARATAMLPAIVARDRAAVIAIVDDVHWGAPALLATLSEWVTADVDQGLLLVVATRDPEALRPLVARLEREHPIVRVGLDGLDVDALDTLARGQRTGVDARWLRRASGGNPFYAQQLLAHIERTTDGATTVPPSLQDAIEMRLQSLSPPCRRLLEAAAVIGPVFPAAVAAAMGRVEPAVAASLLAEARRERLVRVIDDDHVEFAHAVVRDVIIHDLGPLALAQHHREAARLAAWPGRNDEQLLVRARHLLAGADSSSRLAAVGAARVAASYAMTRTAYDDAVTLLSEAAAVLVGDHDVAARVEVLLALCEAANRASNETLSEATGHEACDLAIAIGDYESAARALWLMCFGVEDTPAWHARVELVARHLPAGRDLRVLLDAFLVEQTVARDPQAAVQAADAVDRATSAPDFDPALAATSLNVLRYLTALEPPAKLLDRAERAAAAARVSGDLRLVGGTTMELRMRHLAAGDVERADEFGREYERLAARTRIPRSEARALQHRATMALLHGDLDEAERLATETLAAHSGTEFVEGYALQLFAIRFEQGRLGELVELADAWAARRDVWPGLQLGRALVLFEAGRADEALDAVVRMAHGGFADLPRDEAYLVSLAAAAPVVIALRHRALAVELLELLDPFAEQLILAPSGTLCWGSTARWCAPLAVLLGRTHHARDRFEGAIAMHRRCAARSFLARDLIGYAALLDELGSYDEATAARAEALSLARELDLPRLLAARAVPPSR